MNIILVCRRASLPSQVTRLPNSPDRSLPHLGNTGHGQGSGQTQQTPGPTRSLGSFSVVVPIYIGAIFVFFVYIVAKVTPSSDIPCCTLSVSQILLKKFEDKDRVEEVDATLAYKDDSW